MHNNHIEPLYPETEERDRHFASCADYLTGIVEELYHKPADKVDWGVVDRCLQELCDTFDVKMP